MFVTIQASGSSYATSVGGSLVRTTTQEDRAAFGIFNDQSVKDAVKTMWNKAPNDVFFNDPTDWKDATFANYGWTPVTLTLEPISAVPGPLDIKDYTLFVKEADNGTDNPIPNKFTDTTTLEDTQTNSWSNTSKIVVSEKIGLTFGFFGSDTSVSYEQDWEKAGSSSHKTVLGTQTTYDLVIPPHNRQVITMLGATGKGDVTVTYRASLSGSVFCNYGDPYALPGRTDKHHFYAADMQSILATMGKSSAVQIVQTISLSSYRWSRTTFDNQPLSGAAAEAQVLAVADVNKTLSAG